MRKVYYILLLTCFALLSFGCGKDDNETPPEPVVIKTLLTQLEYPKGLWIQGNKVYFTEANGRAGYGGKNALNMYDVAARTRAVLLDTIVCTEGVVVTAGGNAYMTSWRGTKPGDEGEVSFYDWTQAREAHVANLDIASVDMFIDSNDDIYIIGSSETPAAPSMYRLPVGSYTTPQVIHESLGKTLCLTKSDDTIYYSEDGGSINRFVGGNFESFVNKHVESMSTSTQYLFYADLSGGKIGMINISTKADETIASNLHSPTAVRWDASTGSLYFLEAGTSAQNYKDGALKVITGI
jgi:hypothetical protein